MDENKKVEVWIVKDTDGKDVRVSADSWVCGGNGLKFYLNDVLVAHFIRWASYRKAANTPAPDDVIDRLDGIKYIYVY